MTDELNELKNKLNETDKPVQRHDRIVWVIGILAAIFGVAGGWGAKTLSSMRDTVSETKTELTELTKRVSNAQADFDEYVESKKGEFDEHLGSNKRRFDAYFKEKIKEQDFHTTADKVLPRVNRRLSKLEEFDDQLRNGRLATLRVGQLKIEGGYLQLYDSNGKELVAVGISSNGNGALWLTSKQGHEGVQLVAMQNSGELFLKNKSGKTLVNLGANNSGNGDLRLYDAKGKERVVVGVSTGGSGVVLVTEKTGEKKTF